MNVGWIIPFIIIGGALQTCGAAMNGQLNKHIIFEVDGLNVMNHPTFGTVQTAWGPGSTTFGTVGSASGNRDFQLAGHLNF